MKTGDKLPCVLEVVREVQDGETLIINGTKQEIPNLRRNKFWAVPYGHKDGPEILVCADLVESEAHLNRIAALVALIENGY